MLVTSKDEYTPDTDGRIYRLEYQEKKKFFINFDERELLEVINVLIARNRRLANKFIGLLREVGKELGPNEVLERLKK
jgi:hypothetical protein